MEKQLKLVRSYNSENILRELILPLVLQSLHRTLS